MIGPKDIHNMEQSQMVVKKHFVPCLFSFYEGCLQEGFNKNQSLELTKIYLQSLFSLPSNSK